MTDSISVMTTTKLKAGEKWYVKLPGGTTLVERLIIDVTELTVQLASTKIIGRSIEPHPPRYFIKDIEFIEKVKKKGK